METSTPQRAADDSPAAAARGILAAGVEHCGKAGREDLARRLGAAKARLENPATVLYVAGEYKQGKSLLVNALAGRDVCPVDDDLSTAAVTWLYHRDPALARIRRREDGEVVAEEIAVDDVWRFASEQGNPGNEHEVDLVEIGMPSPVLAHGLTLVDSPGAGALRGGRAEAALSFLPYADAVLFVTDASAELSALEVNFLRTAAQACPHVLVVLTKIDLYPEWRRIADLDREHLGRFELPDTVVPVSSVLRKQALSRGDATLNDDSGFPALLAALRASVLTGSQLRSADRALVEASDALSQVLATTRAAHRALTDPEAVREMAADLDAAKQRLARLHTSGSRWTTVLGDGITDLNQGTDQRLRSIVRRLLEQSDERLGGSDPASDWDDFTERLRTEVATAAGDIFGQIDSGAAQLVERVTAVFDEEGLRAPDVARRGDLDVDSIWGSSERALQTKRTGLLGTGLGALKGTSSGVMLLGVIARLAGIAVATPVAIGVGVIFGAKQLIDERKRQVDRRRQEARTIVRTFLNQVQTELSLEARRTVQEIHRSLRDAFSAELDEVNRTLTDTARSIQESVQRSDHERRRRAPQLEAEIEELERLLGQSNEVRRWIEAS